MFYSLVTLFLYKCSNMLGDKKKGDAISWRITEPISSIILYDNTNRKKGGKGELIEVTDKKIIKDYLNQPMPILPGDSVVLLYVDGKPAFTESVRGTKLIHILNAIEKGVNRTITDIDTLSTRETVYNRISGFFRKKDRLERIIKFEDKKLKIKDLLGDHVFFEGGLRRENRVWIYGLGS